MPRLTDRGGNPSSGQMQTTMVGIVTDNVDPDELGRVQVKFPTLHNEPMSFWLRQSSPMAGKDRGLYAIPEKDDEVLVMFMQGSQDVGVVVGQFWNGVDKPPVEAKDGMPTPADTEIPGFQLSKDTYTDGSKSLDANDRRFWKSRSGHLMVFDDSGGAESIQIWDNTHTLSLVMDPNEQRILLTNTGLDIHIRTAQDFYVEAGRDILMRAGRHIKTESFEDTEIEARMNLRTVSDMNTEMTAKMDWSAKADMNWSANASMNATLEASMNTTVKAGIVCTIQAAVVKIN